jgi:hypothetical protein
LEAVTPRVGVVAASGAVPVAHHVPWRLSPGAVTGEILRRQARTAVAADDRADGPLGRRNGLRQLVLAEVVLAEVVLAEVVLAIGLPPAAALAGDGQPGRAKARDRHAGTAHPPAAARRVGRDGLGRRKAVIGNAVIGETVINKTVISETVISRTVIGETGAGDVRASRAAREPPLTARRTPDVPRRPQRGHRLGLFGRVGALSWQRQHADRERHDQLGQQ